MYIKRDIYDKLVDWKNSKSEKALHLEGARQVGKTYILEKFAKEQYGKKSIIINLTQKSGEDFLRCYEEVCDWKPGEPRIDNYLSRALTLYNPNYEDTRDWLVVFDEIQESHEIYNEIRSMARKFKSRFIVTGNDLEIIYNIKNFFLPDGGTDNLYLELLSFPEFLGAFGLRETYETLDLFGKSEHSDYDEIKKYFDIYLKIGCYPKIVVSFLQTGNFNECFSLAQHLINNFVNESFQYLDSVVEMEYFEKTFTGIALNMLREKKGTKDLVSYISKLVFKEENNKITKNIINQVISWMYKYNQIGYCSMSVDCNSMEIVCNNRYYFNDLGLAMYFLSKISNDSNVIEGLLCENFIYLELCRRIKNHEILGFAPWFVTDKKTDGELDFFSISRKDSNKYGIEVKRDRNKANTGLSLLERGKIKYLYVLKDTYGGINDNILTVPLYLAGRIKFDLGNTCEGNDLKKCDAF